MFDMANLLKGKPLIAAVLLALAVCQGCARFKEIRIVSCGVESVLVKGFKGASAVLSVEVDNPATALTLSDIRGTLNMDGTALATFSAGDMELEKKAVTECSLPVEMSIAGGVSLMELLPMVRNLDLNDVTVDFSLKVKVKNGISRRLEFRDVPASSFLKDGRVTELGPGLDIGVFLL